MGGKAVGRYGGTAASEMGDQDIPPYRPTALPPFSVIGQPLPKIDAAAKCLGRTLFADDIVLPRMLAAKMLRSPHPHARIVSIDTSRAQALEGVKAVITGSDMPNASMAVDMVLAVNSPPQEPSPGQAWHCNSVN